MSRSNEGLRDESFPENWEYINTTVSFSPDDVQVLLEACAKDKTEIQRYESRIANASALMEQLGEYKAKDDKYALPVSEAVYRLGNALKAQAEDDKGWLPKSRIYEEGVASHEAEVQLDNDLGLFETSPVAVEAFELEGKKAVFMGMGWKDENTEVTYAFIADISGENQQTSIYIAPSAYHEALKERLISELLVAISTDLSDIN